MQNPSLSVKNDLPDDAIEDIETDDFIWAHTEALIGVFCPRFKRLVVELLSGYRGI